MKLIRSLIKKIRSKQIISSKKADATNSVHRKGQQGACIRAGPNKQQILWEKVHEQRQLRVPVIYRIARS